MVTAIVAIWQYGITVTGEQNHAGTTSMTRRRDAGLALMQVALRDRQALPGNLRAAHGVDHRPHHARSRQPQHHPAAPSVFQLRDADPAMLDKLHAELNNLVAAANA